MSILRKPYFTVTVTLTLADTLYNLHALAQAAADLRAPAGQVKVPQACSTLIVTNDPTNADRIVFGDDATTLTSYGFNLGVGSTRNYQAFHQTIQFGQLHARSATAGQLVDIEVMTP